MVRLNTVEKAPGPRAPAPVTRIRSRENPNGQVEAPAPVCDLDAEEAVLGAALQSAKAAEVLCAMEVSDFFSPRNREIAGVMQGLRAAGSPIDAVTVGAELAAWGRLEALGGKPYLFTLVQAPPTLGSAPHYARIVQAFRRRRDFLECSDLLRTAAGSPDLEDKLELARQLVNGLGDSRQDGYRFVDGASFVLDAPDGVPAVWGSDDDVLWASEEPLLIVGPAGVGKSTLAQLLVRGRLGLDSHVLGRPVAPEPRRVLYVAADRPSQIVRSMRRTFSEPERQVMKDRLVVHRGPVPEDLAEHPEALLAMAARADAGTVILDSLKDLAAELSRDETASRLNIALQRAVATGLQIVCIHHQRKPLQGGGPAKSLADVYGSTWLTAGAGSVLLLWGDAGDPLIELRHLKQPAAEVGPLKILHDQRAGTMTVQDSPDIVQLARATPGGLTAAAAAERLSDKTVLTKNEVEKARRALETAVRRGALYKVPGTKGGADGGEASRYYAVLNVSEEGS